MTAFDEDSASEVGGNGHNRARVYRNDPKRGGPIRNWWNLLRFAERERTAPEGEQEQEKTLSAAVERSVKLGYEVIEEQIRQGQRAAEEINRRTYGTESVNRDLQELIVRSLRYYVDAAMIVMDSLGSLPASVTAFTQPFRDTWWQPPGPNQAAPPPPASGSAGTGQPGSTAAPAVPIRVSSIRPATVTLDLRRAAEGGTLAAPSLYAVGAGKAPITGVVFENTEDGLVLSVDVPPEQAAGLYSGVVFDAQSEEPRGTLTVRVD